MRTRCLAILFALPTVCLPAQSIDRIMFGSCLDETRPHDTLSVAIERDPDLFSFLGDNVSADSSSPSIIRRSYELLGASPLFQELGERTEILATWDDHDYGRNDAGREFSAREASEQIFEEFWEVPSGATDRPGIYHAVEYGPEGRRVQLILLDTRFFRTPLVRARTRLPGKGPYAVQDGEGTLLGQDQWQWLSEVLERPAQLRVIASSIQVLAEHHGWESWANFPHEQQRLLDMVVATGVPSVFVSGDRHFAEISAQQIESAGGNATVMDITSSGINRGYPNPVPTANANRVGGYYLTHNVGELQLDWPAGGGSPQIRARIYDEAGSVRLEQMVR